MAVDFYLPYFEAERRMRQYCTPEQWYEVCDAIEKFAFEGVETHPEDPLVGAAYSGWSGAARSSVERQKESRRKREAKPKTKAQKNANRGLIGTSNGSRKEQSGVERSGVITRRSAPHAADAAAAPSDDGVFGEYKPAGVE